MTTATDRTARKTRCPELKTRPGESTCVGVRINAREEVSGRVFFL